MPRIAAALLLSVCLCSACGRLGYALQQVEASNDEAAGTPATQPRDDADDADASLTEMTEPAAPERDAGAALPDAMTPPIAADAGLPPSDAGPAVAPDAGATSCAGASAFGLCWYLGEPGASCIDTCGARGGVDARTANYVGVPAQGGSPEECQTILNALGATETVTLGFRNDGLGFGCHRWDDGVNWWIDMPAFDQAAAGYPAQVVCACQE